MKRGKILALAAVVVALAGCGEDKVYDVPYYSENAQARTARLEKCAASPGEYQNDPNCINAKVAQKEVDRKEIRARITEHVAAETARAKAVLDELRFGKD